MTDSPIEETDLPLQLSHVRDLLKKKDLLPPEPRLALQTLVKILLSRFNQNNLHEAMGTVCEINSLLEKDSARHAFPPGEM
ncbi:hypothetical protein PENSTE_c017G05303 [Penicillium steckii]|uniref:Uncharacterized protein n=1 Tax=Penicillium steckii TaxID=303698 RepID=A0A1V6SY57_9EURO|nr:hypothetical protein PENSTE_c017G05303 [Penicillium steckii]